jgi:putative membrane protein
VTDLWLAIAHHVLVFSLVIMLAAEAALVRESMAASDIPRIAGLDMGYGATAFLVVGVGILRVIFGAKGYVYYVENVWFWGKMTTFAVIGILSVPPTLRFRVWQTARKTDPGYLPPVAEIAAMRTYIRWEVRLLIVVAVFAATMARYRSL